MAAKQLTSDKRPYQVKGPYGNNPDGFMVEWRPTALYITAIVMLSASIIMTMIHTTDSLKESIHNEVTRACTVASSEAHYTEDIRELESDAYFSELLEEISRKITLVLEKSK